VFVSESLDYVIRGGYFRNLVLMEGSWTRPSELKNNYNGIGESAAVFPNMADALRKLRRDTNPDDVQWVDQAFRFMINVRAVGRRY
jgi:hypothetical protein